VAFSAVDLDPQGIAPGTTCAAAATCGTESRRNKLLHQPTRLLLVDGQVHTQPVRAITRTTLEHQIQRIGT